VVWGSAHVTLVRDHAGNPLYFFMQLQDITARKQSELDLVHQALHDPLTGLANRALLNDRLIDGLATSRRHGAQLGVIFVDLDQFKVVNDSLGHGTGDELLRHAAARISDALQPGDTLARFGGDEFVVLCHDLPAHTEQVAERICEVLSEPWRLDNEELHITASLGIAFADAASTPDSLLRDADAALYRAKERGRGSIFVFDDALRHRAEHRLSTTSALHGALERGEFVVHYQPIIDIVTGELTGTESLLQWNHPQRGPVGPAEFIPFAEECGVIVPIGAWVLEQACEQLVTWQRTSASASDLTIAVNVSVRQLQSSDIVDVVDRTLRKTGVRPADVCLELTESVLMNDVEYFRTTLERLRALGVRLAIDDFGTGYSSLSYLSRFPIDKVKIDRAFVGMLGEETKGSTLTAVIVAMAGALGLDIVAEGIETREQLRLLRGLGVRRAQGFLLSRPVPAARISELVRSGHVWDVNEAS
jgi:diguanylate cyclase (GGDEF)-like protein